jgi:hypothetical protein
MYTSGSKSLKFQSILIARMAKMKHVYTLPSRKTLKEETKFGDLDTHER